MATFIAISGASTTGKTSLINSLSTYPEMKKVVFSPSIHDAVWTKLVKAGYFTEFTEITKDSEYLSIYMNKLIDYHNDYIEKYKDTDALVVLDECWLDLSIYAILHMWYNRSIKSVQEDIMAKLFKYDENISRIYLTKAEDEKYPVAKDRLRGSIVTFRESRPLELLHYENMKHYETTKQLPSSDISECSLFIIDDLKNLGYL